jgi:hypothetical protein
MRWEKGCHRWFLVVVVVRLVSFLGFTTVVGFATFPFDMAIFTWSGYAKYSYKACESRFWKKFQREIEEARASGGGHGKARCSNPARFTAD